jgi:HD-GYP domain-containing protein (c-di-GMP phosphodiesterase class II)/DNA-binding CsgD family transcriptional regulator
MADLRLAELIAALSQTTDLGMGQPPEAAVRTCLLATGLARRMGLPERDLADVYFAALLQHVGCTAYAHETAAVFGGDDIALRATGAQVDVANPREAIPFLLTGIGKGAPPLTRARAVVNALRLGSAFDNALSRSNCEVAVNVSRRLGMGSGVQRGLDDIYERWDGRGNPRNRAGDDLSLPARVVQVASQGVLFHRLGGVDLAIATVRRRAGSALDPGIADTFARHGRTMLAEFDAVDCAIAVVDAEPEPHRHVAESRLDDIARAFADMTDLKSPYMHGHSAGVSRLAEAAARALGVPDGEVARIRRAGLLHDLGRVGVPNGIWDKPGPLTTTEWEQVRLHPYYSERVLSRSRALAHLAPLAGMHHERLDGTGYHRQATAASIPSGARLLAAADAYQAMTEPRAFRNARTPDDAAAELRADVDHGHLDADAARAVLAVAGHPAGPARPGWPAGLTDREVEVLRLAARGMSNRDIGAALFISPKTADHHIQHIYAKIGVSTRAGAAIFAMEHDLVHEHLPDK